MSNDHVNHHLAVALAPFAPPADMNRFSVAVKHTHGERGCVLTAADRHDAAIKGLERVALRPDEIPAGSFDLRIKEVSE